MLHTSYNYNHTPPNLSSSSGARMARESISKVENLEAEVERLTIICEALWNLLRKHTPVQEIDLIEQMTEIDLASGRLDGRRKRTPPKPCQKCQRPVAPRRSFCLYCGTAILSSPFA